MGVLFPATLVTAAVFAILFASCTCAGNPGMDISRLGSEDLDEQRAFFDGLLESDRRISYGEFKKWYLQSTGPIVYQYGLFAINGKIVNEKRFNSVYPLILSQYGMGEMKSALAMTAIEHHAERRGVSEKEILLICDGLNSSHRFVVRRAASASRFAIDDERVLAKLKKLYDYPVEEVARFARHLVSGVSDKSDNQLDRQ